jgi:hypothetical protein
MAVHEVRGDEASERSGEASRWIETREGGLFFLNAVLVGPEIVVLIPLAVGAVVGLLAPGRAPSPFLDTIPFVASKSIPILGWLLVIPIWTTIRNLRMERLALPRVALCVFLALHLSFLGYALWHWIP